MPELSPNLFLLPHPLTTEGREVEYAQILRNDTLRSFLRRLEILPAEGSPFIASVNGEMIRQADWGKTRLRVGDRIEVRCVARGSSGLRIIGAIVIAIAAIYTGGAAAAAYGGATTAAGATAGAMASMAVTMVGGMVLNAVLPATVESANKYSSDSASTTYSLSAANNSARLYEPLPLIIGSHKIKPDLASKAYTEIAGDDMYLLQAFHFGLQPDLEITEIKIGDTLATSYQGVQIEVSGDDGKLGLVAGNVDTDTGRDIANSDGWITRTSSADTTRIVADLAVQAYSVNTSGEYESLPIEVEMQYCPTGTAAWQPFVIGSKTLYHDYYWSLGKEIVEDGGSSAGDNDWGDPGGGGGYGDNDTSSDNDGSNGTATV